LLFFIDKKQLKTLFKTDKKQENYNCRTEPMKKSTAEYSRHLGLFS